MSIANSQGKIFYGMHFYPGVAEYQEPDKEPYRILLLENTLRKMDPTFAGRPIFVQHVDEVEPSIDELRKEADGWVVESFFNQSDGKHWVKFIVVSERGERAVKNGLKLSNAYLPKSFGQGGQWNGVDYAREVTDGEFDHLALVSNPRYEESIILSPEQFKKYNEDKVVELKSIANSKDKKENQKMGKFNFFKKQKVENDLEGVSVMLPASKKEVTVSEAIELADKFANMDGYANPDHMVKMHDGKEMKVSELLDAHKKLNDEMAAMKHDVSESESDLETKSESVDSESVSEMKNKEDEEKKENKEEDDKEKDKKENDEMEGKELEEAKKKNAKEKADKLRKAHLNALPKPAVQVIELSSDRVARGKARYGSN